MSEPSVAEIKLRRRSRVLEVTFGDGTRHALPFEYLRVHSPSAEVQGHGHGEGVLVTGKEQVGIRAVEPIGQYAVRLVFDDGHDTGLFTWKYLHELAVQQPHKWAQYLERCARSGYARRAAAEPGTSESAGPGTGTGTGTGTGERAADDRGRIGSTSMDESAEKERPG